MVKFARVTPDHLAMIENSLPKFVILYLYALLWSKPADSLEGWAALRFEEWREASGFAGIAAKEFRAVDFSVSQAASWLGKHSRSEAQAAITTTLEAGLLELVARGVKGHPSLFVIAPLPDVENFEYVPEVKNKPSTHLEEDTYRKTADTYQEKVEYVPTSPNKSGTTYNLTNNLTTEPQAACALNDAPPVGEDYTCPPYIRDQLNKLFTRGGVTR